MKRIKFFSLITLVLAFMLAFSGISMAERTLKVAVFPDWDSLMKDLIPAYEAEHPGLKIELQVLGHADHHNQLLMALTTGSSTPDATAIDIAYLGRFIREGGLLDLSKEPYNAGQYADDYVDFSWGLVSTEDNRTIALPMDAAPATLYYRVDVLEEAGISETAIQDVETWEQLVEFGKEVSADTNGDGKNDRFLIADASTVAEAIYRGNIPEDEGIYFDNEGNSIVDNDRFVKAFTVAKKIRDAGLDARVTSWTNEWYEVFKEGSAAIEISGSWLVGHMQNWMAPDTAGQWRAQHLPEDSYTRWGGTFWGIPKDAENKEDAWEFIKYITRSEEMQMKSLEIVNAFPALKSVYEKPIFDEPMDFMGGQKARNLWVEVTNRIDVVNINPNDPVAEEIVLSALTSVLEEGQDVEEALASAKALIKRRTR